MNVNPPRLVLAFEKVSEVVLDVPKKAVAVGTVAGVQLADVLKSADPGAASQVASCAQAGAQNSRPESKLPASADRMSNFTTPRYPSALQRPLRPRRTMPFFGPFFRPSGCIVPR